MPQQVQPRAGLGGVGPAGPKWLLLLLLSNAVIVTLLFLFLDHFPSPASKLLPTSGGERCKWLFVRYEPSEFESLWTENVMRWENSLCEVLNQQPHLDNSRLVIRRVVELSRTGYLSGQASHLNDEERKAADKLMSRMHYTQVCDGVDGHQRLNAVGVQLIEPLWAYLRDPFDIDCRSQRPKLEGWAADSGQSKAHIMTLLAAPYAVESVVDQHSIPTPSSWRTDGPAPWWQHRRRNVMLDLGSAYFRRWRKNPVAVSSVWFYNMYHKQGLPFDRFFAVEASELDVKEAYAQLPRDLVGVYNLINTPLTHRTGSNLDLEVLIEQVAPKDGVLIMKLDIDFAELEINFPKTLLQNATLARLMDELMFEYHVDIPVMRPRWGQSVPGRLNDAYNLFTELRKMGLRAHSWP